MAGDEAGRLAALKRYRILDTEPERAFDDLALLASCICGTPIALITIIDADRQWFKSRVGFSATETSRNLSFCNHVLGQRDLYVVPDTTANDLFRTHPMVVGAPHIRFYAGAPLVTPDGHALGTLCVADHVPRTLTAQQAEALDALRRQVQAQLELRRNLIELEKALAAREQADAERETLIAELQQANDNVKKLSGLMPYCSTCEINMIIPADPLKIPEITDGVTQMLQDKHWSEQDVIAVELALQEAIANAIRHGCHNDPTKFLQCCVTADAQGELMIVVRDPGSGFDAGSVANPLEPANMLKPGGRGIFLINQLMDDVQFTDQGRELQMRKRRAGTTVGSSAIGDR